MKTRTVTIHPEGERDVGPGVEAPLLLCEQCENDSFYIFLVHVSNLEHHPHLECTNCGLTFCQVGPDCKPPEEISN